MINLMQYRGLSKDEVCLISRAEFENQKFIKRDFVLKLFNDKKKTDNLLYNLKKRGDYYK